MEQAVTNNVSNIKQALSGEHPDLLIGECKRMHQVQSADTEDIILSAPFRGLLGHIGKSRQDTPSQDGEFFCVGGVEKDVS